jgi:UDP-glucose 4-epimerase
MAAMKIGVTGAKGFIGGQLIRHLAAAGAGGLRLLVRSPSLAMDAESPEAEVMTGDLSSTTVCEGFVAGLDVIVHLAHCNSPATSERDLPGDARQNLVATLNLLQAARASGRRPHIVYFSSGGAIYAPRVERLPYREADDCAPVSSYGIQKLAAEHYLRVAAAKQSVTAAVLRVGNAYGQLLPTTRTQGLIGVAIHALLAGQPIRLFGDLDNVRDYVHVDDVCRAVQLVLHPRAPFAVYNIGTGVGHSVRQVLELIERALGVTARYDSAGGAAEAGALPEWSVLDIGQARAELGWSPRIALAEGIARMVTEHRSEPRT